LLPRDSSEPLFAANYGFALAPGRVYHILTFPQDEKDLTPSLFSLTPAEPGRFSFCGTFPRIDYKEFLSREQKIFTTVPGVIGARTFLPNPKNELRRLSRLLKLFLYYHERKPLSIKKGSVTNTEPYICIKN